MTRCPCLPDAELQVGPYALHACGRGQGGECMWVGGVGGGGGGGMHARVLLFFWRFGGLGLDWCGAG